MRKIHAAITAVGGFLPPDILTNFDLEKMVDTTDEWIRTRTGVSERHILKGEGKGTSDMGAEAVKNLLEKRGIGAEEIDLIICATVTPDMVFPATANIISDKVGAKNAWSFDVGAACSGFIFALTTGASFIESGRYKKVVVVGGDFANDSIAIQNIVGYQLSETPKSSVKDLSANQLILKKIDIANPKGYKSCVEFLDNDRLITCGTSGVDISKNNGASWETISKESFHIAKKHPTKRGAYLAGSGGRISFVEL